MRWLPVLPFLSAEILPGIGWTTPALVAVPAIPGWVSLHLPHSWLMYCCCSTSSFLPFWQWCGQKQPINLFRLWASMPDPESPVCTCNTCNSNVICHPGVRCFGHGTLHSKNTFRCLTEVWGFLWSFIIIITGFFWPSKSFFLSSPPEEYVQQLKEKAGWSMQAVSSVGAAGREEGQQESCDSTWLLLSISLCGHHCWN